MFAGHRSFSSARPVLEHARSSRGFTLIELMIAVLIIGNLAAISLPMLNKQRERAKDAAAQQSLESGLRAAKALYLEGESFPASGLGAMMGRAERSRVFADGTTFPAAGIINVERRAANDLVLRTTSSSGNQHMLRLEEPDSRVTRYGPQANSAGGALPVISNLVPNPSFENDLANWSTGGSGAFPTVTRDNSWAAEGSWSVRTVSPSLPTNGYSQLLSPIWSATSGTQVSAQIRVRPISIDPGCTIVFKLDWWNGGAWAYQNAVANWGTLDSTSTGEQVLRTHGTIPSGANGVSLALNQVANTGPCTASTLADAAALSLTSLKLRYFDGTSPGASWTGAAHASASNGPVGTESW